MKPPLMKLFGKLIFLGIFMWGCTAPYAQEPPNLIIIHTDEHNFRTLSCYQKILPENEGFVWGKGNNARTPNIDLLAEQGAIATRYYASSPVCTPSRASLVTGLYPHATGAWTNGKHLEKGVPTFAKVLQKEGYATSYVGKWHLAGNGKYKFGIKYKAGFDDNRYMMMGGHAPFFHITPNGVEGINHRQAAKLPQSEVMHLTDYFTEKALEILERDKKGPFCLMLSIPDPHTPDHALPKYYGQYADMDMQPPLSMAKQHLDKRPSWASSGKEDKNEGKGFDKEALRNYFGMIGHIDDSVGKILDFLEENGLTENTIVVFTSDHGDMFFEHNRRNKSVPYEAAARIPFVVRYPNKIPAGKVLGTAYTNVDFTPTMLSLMGVENELSFHGADTSADFTNDEKMIVTDRITYYAKSGGQWVAAVDDRYKLIVDRTERPHLFDLKKDPHELNNVYDEETYRQVGVRLMKALFMQMEKHGDSNLEHKRPYITK